MFICFLPYLLFEISKRILILTAARLCAQKSFKGQAVEMIQDIDVMFESLLRANFEANGRKEFPKRIVYFRDGVSEGQFDSVSRLQLF
jgi:eukaryotic translation initiation factor 2C